MSGSTPRRRGRQRRPHAQRGPHLIDHQQRTGTAAELGDGREVARRGHADAGLDLHRFDDHGGDPVVELRTQRLEVVERDAHHLEAPSGDLSQPPACAHAASRQSRIRDRSAASR